MLLESSSVKLILPGRYQLALPKEPGLTTGIGFSGLLIKCTKSTLQSCALAGAVK
jgi:hypothetical protein